MLAYTIFFTIFSILCVVDNIMEHYNIIFTIWSVIYYVLVLTGNLIYSLDKITPATRKTWKFVFFIVIFGFIPSVVMDLKYGKPVQNASLQRIIVLCIILLALYFPTYWAHYKIGFGREMDSEAV